MVKEYVKKPVKIEAIQWDGENTEEVYKFASNSITVPFEDRKENSKKIHINTLEGVITASIGDFIIKGVAGEFYPCKPDIFSLTYEEIK